MDSILDRLSKEKMQKEQIFFSKFKGLGDMKDTTMNPNIRRLLKIKIADQLPNETYNTFLKLMEKYGNLVNADT